MPQRYRDPPTPRWLTRLAWLSVGLAVVVLFGLYPLGGGDLLMHIVIGRWIWAHGWVPITDPFSYVTAGQPFTAHSWFAELVFYRIEQTTGTAGFMALRFALISVALLCVVQVARLLKAPWPALVLLAPVVLGVMWGRLEFRPQLFTSAFLAFELWLLMSVHTGQRSWPWLWALPPLYALWINLHGGWTEGFGLLVVILVAHVVMDLRDRYVQHAVNGPSYLPYVHLALVLVACVGALFLNPYGARLVSFPLEMQQGWIRALGPEWQSPFARHVSWFTPVWLSYLALVAVMLATHVRRWRHGDLVPVAVMGLWLGLALWHLRALSDCTLLTAPFIAAALPLAWWRGKQWPMLVGSILTLGLVVIALWLAVGLWRIPRGFHWDRHAPVCLGAMLERLGLAGRVYMKGHARADASWLLYRFHPQVQVQKTWEYVAGESTWASLEAWDRGPAELQVHLEAYGVHVLVLSTARAGPGVPTLQAGGWVIVHLEDQWLVMIRQTAAQGMPAYHLINPWTNETVTPGNASQVLQEATRALQQCPDGATFAWAYKAEALRLLGRYEEFFEAERQVPAQLRLE